MKIQTVNQLISVFKDISTRHYQINGFGIGDDWENGASEAKMHPVLWINPTTASMPSSDNGYKTFEIDFEVRVFDLVNKDESNENEVLSDCIDILKDIITEFKGHPYYVNSQLNIIDDINFEAFTEEFDEEVSGWVCEISLMTPVLTSFCGIPSADITGFEFPGADCPDVNVLCPVFVEDVTGVYPIVVTTTGTTKEVSIVGSGLSDTFVISGEYDNGTLTLTRNDDVDVIVTGFDTGDGNDYTTSATLSGNIITFDRTDTVGAYSVDLTSAINSAPDKFVSSGAFDDSSKLLTLTLNDATDFNVDFSTLTTADKFVSSGAYDSINNKIVLTLNDASTVDIDASAIGGGGGIDNVTTAEKSALSPSTGDFVYDTDLNSLQRYNGSLWVSIAKGYGLVSVNDSSGTPTYYTDLQTAINSTANEDTVYIHSDIELTSSVSIPVRHRLIINMQGNRIFGDTTSLDFNLFETVSGIITDGRYLNIIGGGIIETIGSASSVTSACPFNCTGSQRIGYWDLGDTTIKSENADCFRIQNSTLKGGYLLAENGTFFATGEIENTKFRIYESTPTSIDKVNNCDIFMIYGSWFVNQGKLFTNNVIKGTTSKSGNNGLVYGYAGSIITNNYIELESGATRDALYIRSSGTDNHGIKNNVVINLGLGSAGNFVYGSSYDNYYYSLSGWGLRVGGGCKNAVRNTVITNSTTRPALDSLCDYTFDNTAICLNASHTNNAMYVGGTTNEVFNNKAICSNNSIANIKLYSTGTIYIANNTMSSVGSGLDLNGNSNSMINTPDSYNNLQIG